MQLPMTSSEKTWAVSCIADLKAGDLLKLRLLTYMPESTDMAVVGIFKLTRDRRFRGGGIRRASN